MKLLDVRCRDFEIEGLEEIKKYLGEEFSECKDAYDINELLKEQYQGEAGYYVLDDSI